MLILRSTAKTDRLVEWYINQDVEVLNSAADRNVIDFIEANGAELDFIRKYFGVYVRNCNKDTIRWYGDDARFIARNI